MVSRLGLLRKKQIVEEPLTPAANHLHAQPKSLNLLGALDGADLVGCSFGQRNHEGRTARSKFGWARSARLLMAAWTPCRRPRRRASPKLRKARVTSGSNWEPAHRRISAMALAKEVPLRYGRSEVIASKASATAKMRAPTGISWPCRRLG